MHIATQRASRGLIAAVLMLSLGAARAVAAPAAAPLESLSMQVQQPLSAILVSGRLAQDVTLPATLRLPIPSGTTPYWVGEIVGTDPSKDPKATYTIQKAKGYDLVVFTVKQGRTGQVELSLPAAGTSSTLSYSLPIVSKVAQATLSFGLAAGSTLSTSTAGLVGTVGADGEPVFTKTVQNPKVGSVIKESLTYSAGAVTSGATGAGSSGSPVTGGSVADALAVPLWILVLVFAGLFVRAWIGGRRAAVQVEAASAHQDVEESAFDDDGPSRPKPKKAAPSNRTATTASGPTKPRAAATPRARRPQDA